MESGFGSRGNVIERMQQNFSCKSPGTQFYVAMSAWIFWTGFIVFQTWWRNWVLCNCRREKEEAAGNGLNRFLSAASSRRMGRPGLLLESCIQERRVKKAFVANLLESFWTFSILVVRHCAEPRRKRIFRTLRSWLFCWGLWNVRIREMLSQ